MFNIVFFFVIKLLVIFLLRLLDTLSCNNQLSVSRPSFKSIHSIAVQSSCEKASFSRGSMFELGALNFIIAVYQSDAGEANDNI